MKRALLVLSCGFAGILLPGIAVPRQADSPEIPMEKILGSVRSLITEEAGFRHEKGRFAARDELLAYLRETGRIRMSAVDLENPKPYELSLTTSPDGMHFQIAFQHDRSNPCRTAVFSNDSGVIFLGTALGCDSERR